MRIKAPSYFPNWETHSVLHDSEPRRLQMIGAIALQWNFIEDVVDECLQVVLGLVELGTDVTSRINGMDGKTAILHKAIKANKFFNDGEKKLLKTAFDAISEYKKYRDGIIHARVPSPSANVALTAPNRGDAYYIIVATVALELVYQRLELMGDEIVGAYRLLESGSFEEYDLISEGGNVDPLKLRASESFQAALALIQEHQSRRLSLQPLPQFEVTDPSPPASATTQEPQG